MATFSQSNYSGSNYSECRPTYPPEFYEYLCKWAPDTSLCIDVGCGPGSATHQLAKIVARKAIGVDPSETMIETAEKMYSDVDNLRFQQGSDQDLTSLFDAQSIDLLTVAEAAHWFKYPDFFDSAAKILKPNGKLAIWGYIDPFVEGYPEFRSKLINFSYGSDWFGPYWDSGRQLLTDLYKNLEVPKDKFEVEVYDPLKGNAKDYTDHPLQIERTITVGQFLAYFATYSSYHNWKAANPHKKDAIEQFGEEIAAIGLPADKVITLRWDTVVILAHKK